MALRASEFRFKDIIYKIIQMAYRLQIWMMSLTTKTDQRLNSFAKTFQMAYVFVF